MNINENLLSVLIQTSSSFDWTSPKPPKHRHSPLLSSVLKALKPLARAHQIMALCLQCQQNNAQPLCCTSKPLWTSYFFENHNLNTYFPLSILYPMTHFQKCQYLSSGFLFLAGQGWRDPFLNHKTVIFLENMVRAPCHWFLSHF